MASTTNAQKLDYGRKGPNHNKEHLLNCLARFMREKWSLSQRQEYLKKLPEAARLDMQYRLLKAFKK